MTRLRDMLQPLLLCLLALVIAPTVGATTADDTIVIGIWANSGPFDYAVAPAVQQTFVVRSAYERLVNVEVDDYSGDIQYRPGLARAWAVSEEGRIWTFKLNPGHFFNDGTEVTAAAVKFTFERTLALGLGPSSPLRAMIERIEVIDDFTARFYLKDVNQMFLPTLADGVGSIVNPAIMKHEQSGDWARNWLAENTAGSGPYQLTTVLPRDSYVMTVNPFYTGDIGPVKKVVFREIAEHSVRALALEKGDIDIAAGLLNENLGPFRNNKKFNLYSEPTLLFKNVALNMSRGVFAKIENRKAAAYAIDYDAIVDIVFDGEGSRFYGPVPPTFLGGDHDSWHYDYDLGKSMAHFAKARNQGRPEVELIYPVSSAVTETMVAFLQASLAEVGFDVRLQGLSTAALLDRVETGDFDAVYMGWVAPIPEPALLIDYWLASRNEGVEGNYSRYRNPAIDELLVELGRMVDPQQRAALVRRIAALANADVPYLYLIQNHYPMVTSSRVQGYKFNPYALERFDFQLMSKN